MSDPDPYGCVADSENRHLWSWDCDWNEWFCMECGAEVEDYFGPDVPVGVPGTEQT